MGNIITIICALLAFIMLSIDYLKYKKMSKLLGAVMLFLYILYVTPLGSKISKTGENIFVAILFILFFIICYFLLKEEKENKKKSNS